MSGSCSSESELSQASHLKADENQNACFIFSLPNCVLDCIINDYNYSTREKMTVLNNICSRLRYVWRPAKRTHTFSLILENFKTSLGDCPLNCPEFLELLPEILERFSMGKLKIKTSGEFAPEAIEFVENVMDILAHNPKSLRKVTHISLIDQAKAFFNNPNSISCILKASDVLRSVKHELNRGRFLEFYSGLKGKALKKLHLFCSDESYVREVLCLLEPNSLQQVSIQLSSTETHDLMVEFLLEMVRNGALSQVGQLTLGVKLSVTRSMLTSFGLLPSVIPQLKNVSINLKPFGDEPVGAWGAIDTDGTDHNQILTLASDWLRAAASQGTNYQFSFSSAARIGPIFCAINSLNWAFIEFYNHAPGIAAIHFIREDNTFILPRVEMQTCPNMGCLTCTCNPNLVLKEIMNQFNHYLRGYEETLQNYFITRCCEEYICEKFLELNPQLGVAFRRNLDGTYTLIKGNLTLKVFGLRCMKNDCHLCMLKP